MLTDTVKENSLLKPRKCPECGYDGRHREIAKSRCAVCNRGSGAPSKGLFSSVIARLSTFILVFIATVAGFYASLVHSAAPLTAEQHSTVSSAIDLLEAKGFSDEVFLLRTTAAFRSNDNWLNASVEKENAFAATNFPFAIVTLYPEFFERTSSNVERAAICCTKRSIFRATMRKRRMNSSGETEKNWVGMAPSLTTLKCGSTCESKPPSFRQIFLSAS